MVIAEMMAASPVVWTVWFAGDVWRIGEVIGGGTVTESVLDALFEKSPSVSVNWAWAL